MISLSNQKGGLEGLFGKKDNLSLQKPPITQIMLFEQGGRCRLWIGPRKNQLEEDMLSSLLTAICGFSIEALGLELSEIAAKDRRIFLARVNKLGIAIIVKEELRTDYLHIKTQIRCLMNRITDLVSEIEVIRNPIEENEEQLELGFLRYEIEMAIAQTFPSSHVNSDNYGIDLKDIYTLRILTCLGAQDEFTKAKMTKQLDIPQNKVEERLSWLEGSGFVSAETVQFGQRNLKAYHISELGKLVLDHLEVGFPGIWK